MFNDSQKKEGVVEVQIVQKKSNSLRKMISEQKKEQFIILKREEDKVTEAMANSQTNLEEDKNLMKKTSIVDEPTTVSAATTGAKITSNLSSQKALINILTKEVLFTTINF